MLEEPCLAASAGLSVAWSVNQREWDSSGSHGRNLRRPKPGSVLPVDEPPSLPWGL